MSPGHLLALAPFIVVLGIGQDGGVPQAGRHDDPRWEQPEAQERVVSLGLVDGDRCYLFEATPDLPTQLRDLVHAGDGCELAGVFLTHAHIGHYTGLMYLGHEVMGAQGVPAYVMPRFADFLSSNGPWDQLVRYGNVELQRMSDGQPVILREGLSVTPLLVPHRQEYAETIGFRIEGPERSVLFIPDIDSWEQWDEQGVRIEDEIARVDVAYLDATFYADGEIPGRDMSGFPHPFISHSMARFADLPAEERAKVRFIHLNHSNPALDRSSREATTVLDAGFELAEEGERQSLGSSPTGE